jgi:hypothetical protein
MWRLFTTKRRLLLKLSVLLEIFNIAVCLCVCVCVCVCARAYVGCVRAWDTLNKVVTNVNHRACYMYSEFPKQTWAISLRVRTKWIQVAFYDSTFISESRSTQFVYQLDISRTHTTWVLTEESALFLPHRIIIWEKTWNLKLSNYKHIPTHS